MLLSVSGFAANAVQLTDVASEVGVVAVGLSSVAGVSADAVISVQVVLVKAVVGDGTVEVVSVVVLIRVTVSLVTKVTLWLMVTCTMNTAREVWLSVVADSIVDGSDVVTLVVGVNLAWDMRNVEIIKIMTIVLLILNSNGHGSLLAIELALGNGDSDLVALLNGGGGSVTMSRLVTRLFFIVVDSPEIVIGVSSSLVLLIIVRVSLDGVIRLTPGEVGVPTVTLLGVLVVIVTSNGGSILIRGGLVRAGRLTITGGGVMIVALVDRGLDCEHSCGSYSSGFKHYLF